MLRLFENNRSDLFLFFAMMRIEPRASCILGKYSTMELYPSPKTDYCHYDCCCVCFCGMHVCIHGHMVVLTSTWGSQRTSHPHVFLDCPPLSLLSSGFVLSSPTELLQLAGSPRCSASTSQCWITGRLLPMPSFYVVSGDPNSSPHAYVTRALSIEPVLQPKIVFLIENLYQYLFLFVSIKC